MSDRKMLTAADVIAALPEDGSGVTENELYAALGLRPYDTEHGMSRYVLNCVMWKAAGFAIRRDARGRVSSINRWVEKDSLNTHETVT